MPNWRAQAARAAREVGVPVPLFLGLVDAESGFNPNARSPVGARRFTQLMPGTAAGLARKYGIDTSTPYGNLLGGAHYLKEQLQAFGDPRKALAAYNAGPGAVQKYGGVPPYAETQAYVKKIMSGLGSEPLPVAGPGPSAPRTPRPVASLVTPPRTIFSPVAPSGPSLLQAATEGLGEIARGGSATASAGRLAEAALAQPRQTQQMQKVATVRTPPGQPNYPVLAVKGTPKKQAAGIVALAQQYIGTPYSWGGGGPAGPSKGFGRGANTVGFDCSSFLQFVWSKQGVAIPRVTYDQWKTGQRVARSDLRPGDAVFFHPGPRGPEHVGMFIGGGRFIEAPRTGLTIRISKLAGRSDYMGARRYG